MSTQVNNKIFMSAIVKSPISATHFSVVGLLKELSIGVKNLVPDAILKIRHVNKILDRIEKEVSFKCHTNPQVASEIEELKQAFRTVIIHSDRYVIACRNLAKYFFKYAAHSKNKR